MAYAFLRPLGIVLFTLFPVQALYPEPCTQPYEILIYLHSSAQRVLLPVGSGLQGLQQLWGRPAYNLLGVRPNPTVYSLYALNLPSPGFEPKLSYTFGAR